MSQLNESEKEHELFKGELSGSIIERAGTYISEFIKKEHRKAEQTKRNNTQTVLSEMEQFFNRLDAILNRMGEIAKELSEIEKKLKALKEVERLYKYGKFDFNSPEHIIMLTQTGVNIEDFETNGLDAINDRRNELIYDKERLIKEYHGLEDEFQNEVKNRPDGVTEQEILEKYSNRLEDLHSKVKDQNMVVEAMDEFATIKDGNSVLFKKSHKTLNEDVYDEIDTYSEQNENKMTSSSHNIVDNDPFAETANISDPFNEVALGFTDKNKSLQSENTFENSVDKNFGNPVI